MATEPPETTDPIDPPETGTEPTDPPETGTEPTDPPETGTEPTDPPETGTEPPAPAPAPTPAPAPEPPPAPVGPTEAETIRTYLTTLNRAIGTGARSVTLGGQTIIYNTTESLIKARNDLHKQLQALEAAERGGRVASRQNYAVFGGRDYH